MKKLDNLIIIGILIAGFIAIEFIINWLTSFLNR